MPTALPVIDLRGFSTPADLAGELLKVGKNPGFFYLVGHGLGDRVADDIFSLAASFFGSTAQEKRAYANGSGDLGYTGMREETLSGKGAGDVKESFYLSDPGGGKQPLPAQLEVGREKLARFFDDCRRISDVLLQSFAIGLGVPQDFLSRAHSGECCRVRLIKYPPVEMTPPPEGAEGDDEHRDVRAGAHSDYGSLTLLFRQPSDRGGLQVLVPDGGHGGDSWIDVPCLADAIVVNIGDALEFWTAGRLRSTVHRVAFPRCARENVARLSIPVFIQPDRNVILAPLLRGDTTQAACAGATKDDDFVEVLRRKGYPSAKPLTSREHLARRIGATYRRM